MSDQAQKLRSMMGSAVEANDERQSPPTPSSRAEVIAVTSGKGGVGKSNLAVNLGITLSQKGYEVAVADMDLGLANVNVITDKSPEYTLHDVLRGRRSVNDILEKGPGDISILAGASGEEDLANLSERECQEFIKTLSELDRMVDVLIVDTAAGMSSRVMQFVCAADRTILVTTPEPTAITDAYAVIKSGISYDNSPDFNLVINRAESIMEGKKVAEKMKRVGEDFLDAPLRILGYMTEDESVMRAVRKRRPFVLEYPQSRVTQCVDHIESRLMEDAELQDSHGVEGFFSRIVNWLG
ncbi:MAG: MinD/ParA family protein [bacterium]